MHIGFHIESQSVIKCKLVAILFLISVITSLHRYNMFSLKVIL